MTLPSDRKPETALLELLFALPNPEQQVALLDSEDLLNPDGMDALLDLADELVRSDPGKAYRLATLCAEAAHTAGAPAAVPRADYIRLGAHAENGEFDAALHMCNSAYEGYVALGETLQALRTHVGRMWILLELGRYEEALNTGQGVLDTLGSASESGVTPTQRESSLLIALVQQNRGVCYEYMGRYNEALDAYATAEELYRKLGETERVGEILDNRGAILLNLGRGSEALEAHEAAAATFEQAGLVLSHARALGNIGEAHLRLASYTHSLDAFEKSRRLLRPLNALSEECFVMRNMADAYLALNLYSEALAAYQEVNALLRDAGIEHDRARTLWGMGSVLVARADFGEAERALRGAAAKFAAAGNLPLLSSVMLEQASLLAAREQWEAALDTAYRALELVSEDGWPVQTFYAHLRLADLLLPNAEEVEAQLRAARRLSDRLDLPHLRYRLDERLGHLRRLQGRYEEARLMLEAAVEDIERLRGTVTQEAMRASFLRDKTSAYEDLLLVYLACEDDEDIERAFAIAEKAKSRALVDLLTGATERTSAASADPERDETLRDLQADLNTTYNQMLDGTGRGEQGLTFPKLHQRAVDLERKISRLRLSAVPHDSLMESLPSEEVRERLPSGVTLLAYHVMGDEIMAFVSVGEGIRAVRNLGSAAMVAQLLQRLDMQWDRLRLGPEFVDRHMGMLVRATQRVLTHLYTVLVEPLERFLGETADSEIGRYGDVPQVAIVPHGLLHQVPFHALYDGQRYLLERFEISYAPSAKIYALCQERGSPKVDGALVVGVSDPLIPAVTQEARAIARRLPNTRTLVDEQATSVAFRREAWGRGALHLACHGLFRSDNSMFSALQLYDNWLTAADVMSLDLSGALVTLSACESGRNKVVPGDELIGLTRAFLGAGAATLVVSLWLVQDEATARLMEHWYERLAEGMECAAALREAQLVLKDEFPHPYHWAPFVLVGKR